jgi:hypothetical protein
LRVRLFVCIAIVRMLCVYDACAHAFMYYISHTYTHRCTYYTLTQAYAHASQSLIKKPTKDTKLKTRSMQARIYANAPSKRIGSVEADGASLADLAQAYCMAINEGAVPAIQDAYTRVCEGRLRRAVAQVGRGRAFVTCFGCSRA